MAGRYINQTIGNMFAAPLKISGYLLIVTGLVVAISGGWGILFGFILLVVGGFFGFTKSGIVIDTRRKSIKQYTQFYGFKRGSFKEYSNFPFVTVISKKRGSDEKVFEVNLLSKSHRGKVLLGIKKDEIAAKEFAREMTTIFSVDLVDYQPQLK